MEYLSLVILGAIQGATEFLPVSSSGHLALATQLLRRGALLEVISESPLVLEILLHLATLLAVVLFYRRDILGALKGFIRLVRAAAGTGIKTHLRRDDDAALAFAVIIGTLPTGVIGVLLGDASESVAQNPLLLGLSFLSCAVLLFTSRFFPGRDRPLTPTVAIIIGTVQGIAVFPGISRSGVTIAVALALGLRRDEAVRFSFLLSLPAILGAALLEVDPAEIATGAHLGPYLAGSAAAFVIGLLALFLLVQLVRKGRLWLFAPYVAAAGLFSIFCLG